MSVATDMMKQLSEPTWADLQLELRKKKMQRELDEQKLAAFDANKEKLKEQLARANQQQGYTLNGIQMRNPEGTPILNQEDAAVQQLRDNPMLQLSLLEKGDTGEIEAARPMRLVPLEGSEEEQIQNAANQKALLEYRTRLRLKDLVGKGEY